MAALDDGEIDIGTLRWRVTINERAQTPAAGAGTGITETSTVIATVHADIQSVGALTFWGGQQVDTPVTHRIIMRWTDFLDQQHSIIRQTRRLDGTYRTETFRIRRIRELSGRKRFVMIEAELEAAS